MTSIDEIIKAASTNARLEELSRFCKTSNVVLYGAGLTGKTILKKLQLHGISPLFIADDTLAKHGTSIEGVVIKPITALEQLEEPYALIVTMMNPEMNFHSLRSKLNADGIKNVFSFLELSFLFPGDLLPYFHFDVKEELLKDTAKIEKAFGLFLEAGSQDIFLRNLSFRLNLDFGIILVGDKDDYFPSTIIDIPEHATFFDCGAFDGDTIKTFIKKHPKFDNIIAFEPDPENFNKLLQYCSGLDNGVSEKVYVFNNGLDSGHRFLKFNSLNNMASSISDEGNIIIQTVGLDQLFLPMLKDYSGKIFIKMDIEGAEPSALEGCRQLISEKSPCLAISIYHNPDDMWSIPLYIDSINPGYTFLLRQHGNDSMDLVLYAIPKQ